MKSGFFMFAVAVVLTLPAMDSGAGAGGAGTAGGIYSEAQAERGQALYEEHCVMCHGERLTGGHGVPALKGPEFRFLWAGRSLKELFEAIATKMPPGQAGTLTEQEYIDVIAASLRANGFPTGAVELSAGALADIPIEW